MSKITPVRVCIRTFQPIDVANGIFKFALSKASSLYDYWLRVRFVYRVIDRVRVFNVKYIDRDKKPIRGSAYLCIKCKKQIRNFAVNISMHDYGIV